MFPETLMDRLGEELRDAHTSLSPKAEGREVPWVRGWGGGALTPKPTCYDQDSLSPLAHTDDGEAPQCPSLRLSLLPAWPGLPVSWDSC